MGKDTKKKHQTPKQSTLSQPKTPSVSKFFDKAESEGRTQRQDKMAEAPVRSPSPDRSSSVSPVPSTQPDIHELLSLLPTKADLRDMASTIKAAHKAELAGVKDTLREIGEKLGEMEAQTLANAVAIKRTVVRSNDHHKHIYLLRRQLEDLDNRGRRNNIRVRGVPEAVAGPEIESALQNIFNSILDRPLDTVIEFDRAHRALGSSQRTERPRDLICCLHSHKLKELIMQKTRTAGQITFSDMKIEVYQDLAWITLQQRRALRPLTKSLHEKGVKYRWGYPFALVVHKDGRSYTLREPDDLRQFCTDLGLPVMDVEEWRHLMYNGDDLPVPRVQDWESPSKRQRANTSRTKD